VDGCLHIHVVGLKRSNCALINGLVEWGAQMVVDLLFEIHSCVGR